MAWFDFIRSPSGGSVETLRIPLFPLNTVLFPGGVQALKIFEQRYLDMAAACLKDNTPFGICLIEAGGEVGEAAVPHPFGTLAHITDWDMEQLGLLMISTRGGRRFRVLDHEVERDGLLVAEVRWLEEPALQPVPEAQSDLLPLLQSIVTELGERLPPPHRFEDAAWVGARYAELLPIPLPAQQSLLELDDVLSRLEVVEAFLREHGLLPRPA